MKIKKGYVIRKVMGNNVVIATGEASRNFHGMVKLNDTAAEMWEYISRGMSKDEIVQSMLEKYDVEEETLRHDLDTILETLVSQGFVEL